MLKEKLVSRENQKDIPPTAKIVRATFFKKKYHRFSKKNTFLKKKIPQEIQR